MKVIRFALVGCGRIVKKHIEAIMQTENAELAAVCDSDMEQARKVGEFFQVPYYSDYHKMLEQEQIDVVNILTPSGLHARIAIDIAANYRKHIIVEKPMALTLQDADDMIRVCEENGVKLFVVKQNRYNLPVLQVRKALEQGRFGKLVMGTVRVRWARTQAYYDQAAWRGTWALDGGVLANQASHHVDLLVWMLGEVEEVYAQTSRALADIETEDTAAVVLRFANGALGIIEATTAARPVDLEGSLSILGERGAVEVGGFAVNEMKTWNFADQAEEIADAKEFPPNVYGFGHARFLADVVSAVNGCSGQAVEGREGRYSLEVIQAIYESAETKLPVRLKGNRYLNSPLGKTQRTGEGMLT